MKKFLYPLLMSLLLVCLVACTNEKDLTTEWKSIAEEKGIPLESSKGAYLRFSPEGMKGNYVQLTSMAPIERPFPFEGGEFYPTYQITRKGDKLTTKADDLSYELMITGERIFYDGKNDIEYRTVHYLVEDDES